MDSAGQIDLQPPAARDRRDWLSISWTALLVAYSAAAVPVLGGALVYAL